MAQQGGKGKKRRKNRSDAMKETMRKRTEARKEARRAAQSEREARNKELRAQGLPTPHEEAKAARRARRQQDRAA